jgi:cation transport ATPase
MKARNHNTLIDTPSVGKKDLEPKTTGLNDLSENCSSTTPINNPGNETILKEYVETERDVTISFAVGGMSCVSCQRKIEDALYGLQAVKVAHVNFIRREAVVVFNKDRTCIDELKAAVKAQGYSLLDKQEDSAKEAFEDSHLPMGLKPFLIGVTASLGVVGFYLGLLTLTSDWYNARLEFGEYGTWIIALALGLGVQATLFSLYRAWRRGESIKAAKYGLVASGGMSTMAMAACCAHYLAVLLPALGLPFLSAATASLASYQVYFFMAGVISNLFGIGVMLRMMHRSGMIQLRFSITQSPICFRN